ncbi:ankyrin repeat domain-containing protein [Rapidithrix thailandica]|uniref:Ankyrin repeat domain-containing protein n=1 Tax=Rapidithrix thailandica TaxID=413964 RepID=A0AAW9SEW3_9BACT
MYHLSALVCSILLSLLLTVPCAATADTVTDVDDKALKRQLEEYIRKEQTQKVKQLIETHQFDVNYRNQPWEPTLLFYASSRGNRELVDFLLEKGAEVNVISRYGMPIQWAADNCQLELIRLFLEVGYDPKRESAAYWQAKYTQGDTLTEKWIFDRLRMIERENIPFDLRNKAINELFDPSGNLLLSTAATCNGGDRTLVKEILAKGYPVDLIDKRGATALHYSIQAHNKAMVKLLIAKGADVNLPISNPEWARMLRQSDFDNNLTPLLIVAKELSELKQNEAGEASLYQKELSAKEITQARKELYAIAKLLLKNGADAEARTHQRKLSALDVAKQLGDTTFEKILKR